MTAPVAVVVLLPKLRLHLGQLPLQLLGAGPVGLGVQLPLQLRAPLLQLLDLPVHRAGVAGAALRLLGRAPFFRGPRLRVPLRAARRFGDRKSVG